MLGLFTSVKHQFLGVLGTNVEEYSQFWDIINLNKWKLMKYIVYIIFHFLQ